jgi:hypothetical protein
MQHLVIVFLHVASAMGIVASFGIESLVLTQLRAARTATDARTVLSSYRYSQRAGAASLIVTVVTGIYLATAYWGWRGAWMGIGFLTLVAIAIIGATMTGRAVTRLLRVDSVDAGAALPSAFVARLRMSFLIRMSLFVGIVFLMTVKPVAPVPALSVISVAALLGVLFGLPAMRRAPALPNEPRAPAR